MKTKFTATGIGSMPFEDPDYAVKVSLSKMCDAPIWPQLPKLGLHEQMEIQYSEGMAGAIIDEVKHRMYFDTSKDCSEAFAQLYEGYIAATEDGGTNDFSAMAITPAFSKGIYALEKALQAKGGAKLPFVKVQTTGPCSFALTLVDENKRAIYYNDEFRDMIVKALSMKCRWQIQKFQEYAEKIICFIDEPILSAFGSSTYVSVKREDVVSLIQEVSDAVHAEDALSGVHCCGNTEWSILIDAGVDIVNFDAFSFGETIAMYPEAVKAHLERGGILAWGIVPTDNPEHVEKESVDSLLDKWEAAAVQVQALGFDRARIMSQSLITPSCGTGSLTLDQAVKVLEMTQGLSARMRKNI